MPYYATCPECDSVIEVESTHNGVCGVWHAVHCGWGRDYFGCEPIYALDREAAEATIRTPAVTDQTEPGCSTPMKPSEGETK